MMWGANLKSGILAHEGFVGVAEEAGGGNGRGQGQFSTLIDKFFHAWVFERYSIGIYLLFFNIQYPK